MNAGQQGGDFGIDTGIGTEQDLLVGVVDENYPAGGNVINKLHLGTGVHLGHENGRKIKHGAREQSKGCGCNLERQTAVNCGKQLRTLSGSRIFF